MRSTIKDVAKLAGFSITMVSMVLNNKQGVSIPQSTRAKVLNAAKQLNYRPNRVASNLVNKKSNILGLIIPDNANLFFAELSKSIEEEARLKGYTLIYGNSYNKFNRDIEYFNIFADLQVDGIIITSTDYFGIESEKAYLNYIKNYEVPILAVDRDLNRYEVNSVSIDNKMSARKITEHLINNGHKRIGCITGPKNLSISQDRLEGYKVALEENGIPYCEDLILEGDFEFATGLAKAQKLLKKEVTAIFAFNDMMAYGVYKEASRQNLVIPDDISVVGFDNILFSELIVPPLTTVAQPVGLLGKFAVETLVNQIENSCNELKCIVMDGEVIVRESVANLNDIEIEEEKYIEKGIDEICYQEKEF